MNSRLWSEWVIWSQPCPSAYSWGDCCICRPPTLPWLLTFTQRSVWPHWRLRCTATLLSCPYLHGGLPLPGGLLLHSRGYRSVPEPSESLFRCPGYGDPVPLDWSESLAAGQGLAPDVPPIEWRLVNRWRLPPSSPHVIAVILTSW